jgi:FKBP-type peptidyl-prolyl cis-trans isomerase SlyD
MIAAKKVVSIHYTLKNGDGEMLDSSDGSDPLVYLHGAGNIVEGLEKALDGKAVGDKVIAVVPPAEGYGERSGPGPQPVPREAFTGVDVRTGMAIMAEDEGGAGIPLWVVAVESDRIMVDGNHPLAGETLHFDVEVVDVRDATTQELDHGHVHTGGHDH